MAESLARELIARYHVVVDVLPFLCEDCEQPTDLGHKCRACYAIWSRLLWQDVPRAHRQLLAITKTLRKHDLKREIARHAEFGKGSQLSTEATELLEQVRACKAGPFGGSMDLIVGGILKKGDAPTSDDKPARSSARLNAEGLR